MSSASQPRASSEIAPALQLDSSQYKHESEAAIAPWTARYFNGIPPFPRRSFAYTATASASTEIFLFSGETKQGLQDDLHSIQPSTLRVESLETTGDGPTARGDARAVRAGQAIIVFGGLSQSQADSDLYILNTATRNWSVAAVSGGKPMPRKGHSLTLVGTHLVVFGGQGGDGTPFNDLLMYNVESLFSFSSAWSEVTSARTARASPRSNHTAVMHSGKLYIYGGLSGKDVCGDLWEFDPETKGWTQITCYGYLPGPRHSHAAVVIDGIMYVTGGVNDKGQYSADMYAYRFASRYWHRLDMVHVRPTPRANHALCAVDSKLFLFGGEISQPHTEDQAIYVCSTDSITFPAERQGFRQERIQPSRLWQPRGTSPGRSTHSRSTTRSIGTIRNDLSKDIMRTMPKDQQPDALSRVMNNFGSLDVKRSLTSKDFAALEQASGYAREKRVKSTAKSKAVNEPSAFHTVNVHTFSAIDGSLQKPTQDEQRYRLPSLQPSASPLIVQGPMDGAEQTPASPASPERKEMLDALGISRTGTSPVMQGNQEGSDLARVRSNDKMPDATFLMHALQVLREEHQRQRKIATQEREAIQQAAASRETQLQLEHDQQIALLQQKARVHTNREIQLARAKDPEEHQGRFNAFQRQQDQSGRDLSQRLAQLSSQVDRHKETAKSSAEEQEKLMTQLAAMDKQNAELVERQSHQIGMISSLTTTISAAQRRAEESESQAKAEAERSQNLEQEVIKLTARVEELQSQTEHYRKLSSLATFNAEHNATEMENTRQILFNGLHKLIGKDGKELKEAVPDAATGLPPVRLVAPLEVKLGQQLA